MTDQVTGRGEESHKGKMLKMSKMSCNNDQETVHAESYAEKLKVNETFPNNDWVTAHEEDLVSHRLKMRMMCNTDQVTAHVNTNTKAMSRNGSLVTLHEEVL